MYVDDILIFSNNDKKKFELKKRLNSEFMIKDLGTVKSILGTRIRKEKNVIKLNQNNYIQNHLIIFNMLDCKAASISAEVGLKIEKSNVVNDRLYQELIEHLNYLTLCTRPDISHTVADLNKI